MSMLFHFYVNVVRCKTCLSDVRKTKQDIDYFYVC